MVWVADLVEPGGEIPVLSSTPAGTCVDEAALIEVHLGPTRKYNLED